MAVTVVTEKSRHFPWIRIFQWSKLLVLPSIDNYNLLFKDYLNVNKPYLHKFVHGLMNDIIRVRCSYSPFLSNKY